MICLNDASLSIISEIPVVREHMTAFNLTNSPSNDWGFRAELRVTQWACTTTFGNFYLIKIKRKDLLLFCDLLPYCNTTPCSNEFLRHSHLRSTCPRSQGKLLIHALWVSNMLWAVPLFNLRADPASLSVVCHMSLSTLGFRVESDIYISRLDSCDIALVGMSWIWLYAYMHLPNNLGNYKVHVSLQVPQYNDNKLSLSRPSI